MFSDLDGERYCLMCGERTYDWFSTFLDRLLDAMDRQTIKELRGTLTQTLPRQAGGGDDPSPAGMEEVLLVPAHSRGGLAGASTRSVLKESPPPLRGEGLGRE
jgi:hypothetical protein